MKANAIKMNNLVGRFEKAIAKITRLLYTLEAH